MDFNKNEIELFVIEFGACSVNMVHIKKGKKDYFLLNSDGNFWKNIDNFTNVS